MIYDWMINVIGKKKTTYWLYSECERDECVMTHLSYHSNYTVFFALPHGARALTIVTKFIANEPIVIGTLYVACRVNESYWLGIDFPVWNTNERIFIQTLTERKKIVDGALKMCKYDWMAIVHRIACDVNDTVNGWGSGQTRSQNEIHGFSSFSIFINIAKLKV